jgi:hypothetical protein
MKVDDDIADLLYAEGYRLHVSGDKKNYIYISIDRKSVNFASWVNGTPAGLDTDHIDRDTLNNQRANLRNCTVAQNLQNRRGWGADGFKGVVYKKARPGKQRACYEANINLDGKRIYLGQSQSAEAAARMYDQAALEHYGPDAYQNFPAEATVYEDAA